jgi:unsaturated rhamnogalacturonyl hydrolase
VAISPAVTPAAALPFNKNELNDVAKSAIKNLTSMPGWTTNWDWAQGVGLYGIWKYYEATGDEASLEAVQDWYTARLPSGQKKHVNTMSVMSTLADLYNTTRDPKRVPYLEEWGSWCMYNLTRTLEGGMQHITQLQNKEQLWADTLMMPAVPLAKIGLIFNKPEYVLEAKKQFDIHLKYLHDSKTGLFFHGWTFIDKNNFAGAHWARGNAWAAICLADILELLFPDDKQDSILRGTLDAQLSALQPLQDLKNDGLWRTVVDYPLPNSYIETSASAGFLATYQKVQRKGWVAPGTFDALVTVGIKGVIKNVAKNGEVKNVSAGTGMGSTIDYYYKIKKIQTEWGQALAVIALTEVWRTLP